MRWIGVIALLWVMVWGNSAQEGRSVILPANAQLVTEVAVLSTTDALNDGAFSPDSRFLATVGDDTALRLWDAATGEPVAEAFEHFSFVKRLVWDGDTLVTGSWDRTAILWDVTDAGLPTRRDAITGYDAVIDALALNGNTVILGVGDGHLRGYDLGGKQVTRSWTLPALRVTSIAISPDGQAMIAAGGYPATGAQWLTLTGEDAASPIDITYAGTVFAATYITPDLVALGGDLGTVVLWDTTTQQPIGTLEQNDWVIDMAVSPDSTLLAVARQDGVLTLWDISTPAQSELIVAIVASDSAALTSVAFSPDGRLIATTDDDGIARLWGIPVK